MRRLLIVLALLLAATIPLAAQRGWGRRIATRPNVPYDGQFTIVRLWYANHPGWSFDYPYMEDNLGLIMKDLTTLRPNEDGSNIFTMDDPELLRFPVAYLSEPGYWYPNEAEVLGLRQYLQKGGFLIVDDFMIDEWWNFERSMKRVLPDARIDRLDLTHPVFDTFFGIKSLDVPYPGTRMGYLTSEFYGIHEDNDPAKRLMVVINYNADIGDYMEHSGTGRYVVDPTNEAFKFGVNYMIYGLTR